MLPDEIWQTALGQLQMQMTRATFDTWVKNSRGLAYEDGTFVVGVSSGYAKDWLENRLNPIIRRTLTGVMGRTVEVRYVVWARQPGGEEGMPLLESSAHVEVIEDGEPAPALREGPAAAQDVISGADALPEGLSSRYTFDTFVVGAANRLAHAAALAVAENPARAYNPLFIYGGVGLGKTHLLHAIGHACRMRGLHVMYVSSEKFTNDLIAAIKAKSTERFRDRYRSMDVLLIDDIQFIAGKESTQEEFFHTFNALHSQERQLVISSDRPPKALVTLEDRLRSRFEWGLIADIQAPDLETRIAILQQKSESLQAEVPYEVLERIARQVQSNIRELEGALNRVVVHARLMGMGLTPDIVPIALADLMPKPASMTIRDILQSVAAHYQVTLSDLLGRSRSAEIVEARHIAIYLARTELNASFPQIGQEFGGRDHTTIMHACEKINDQIERNDGLRRDLLAIKERLYSRAQAR
jgi:chromosomal replication initiator protein